MKQTVYYSKQKGPLEEEPRNCCAKEVKDRVSRYFVMTVDGKLMDPYDIDTFRQRKSLFKWRPTNETAFNFYVRYLSGGYKRMLTHAERNM